jgi:hypothetical protein
MRGQGHKGRIVAGSTIADPELPRLMGKAGDGTTIPTTFYGDLNDRTKKFEAPSSREPRRKAWSGAQRRSSTRRPLTSC